MPISPKFKGFWNNGPRWWRWLKRAVILLIAWPLLMTLIYAFVPVPASNLMLVRLLEGYGLRKQWVGLDGISPNLPRAVVASEDERFCEHHGVDWIEFRSAITNDHGRVSRGASTLSMQVAKNLFLWEGHSFIRKGLELPLATYMDLVLTKRRMMTIYLNIAEWGPGLYGAEAAAQHYFGKSAASLTRAEAALLVASLPNPFKRVADHPSPGLRGLARRIELKALGMGGHVSCLHQNPPL